MAKIKQTFETKQDVTSPVKLDKSNIQDEINKTKILELKKEIEALKLSCQVKDSALNENFSRFNEIFGKLDFIMNYWNIRGKYSERQWYNEIEPKIDNVLQEIVLLKK